MLVKATYPPPSGFFYENMANPEFLITLPRRGLKIIPPPETQENMRLARSGQKVFWTPEEKTRLRELISCTILEKRYPTKEDGQKFMAQDVDYGRREELLSMALELTNCIVSSWQTINPQKDIAIILFGSIAKGLVKKPTHPNPSNVDLAVIGDFTPEERDRLFDGIRCKRGEIQQKIISGNPNIDPSERNPGNAGVFIQTPNKLSNNDFSATRIYVRSNAQALYDPAGIWKNIEKKALAHFAEMKKLSAVKS